MRTWIGVLALALVIGPQADALDSGIQQLMKAEHVPGLSFAVVRHGRIVRTGGYGLANLEWKAPVTADTKFEAASISKMFAGGAVRILVEEGRVDPEDAIAKY